MKSAIASALSLMAIIIGLLGGCTASSDALSPNNSTAVTTGEEILQSTSESTSSKVPGDTLEESQSEMDYADPLGVAVGMPASISETELKILDQLEPGLKNHRYADEGGLSLQYRPRDGETIDAGDAPVQPTKENNLDQAYITKELIAFVYGGSEAIPEATVMISTDEAKTWTEVKLDLNGQTFNRTYIDFYDISLGHIVFVNSYYPETKSKSLNVVYETRDGGKTWEEISRIEMTGTLIHSLHFSTPDIGFAPCLSNNILRTIDGGKTWQDIGPSLLSLVERQNSELNKIWIGISALPYFEGKYGVLGIAYNHSDRENAQVFNLYTIDSGMTWFAMQ